MHQKVVLLVPTPGSQPPDLSSDVALKTCDPEDHPHEIDAQNTTLRCPPTVVSTNVYFPLPRS